MLLLSGTMQSSAIPSQAGNHTGFSIPPDLAFPVLLWGALTDIEAVVTGKDRDSCPACSAVGHLLDEMPGRPARISRGATAADVAGFIAAQLIRGARPVTGIFAGLLGRDIRLDVIGPHMRPGQGDETGLLRLRDGDQLYVRDGILMAGTISCARVSLRLVPDRVTGEVSGAAWELIRSGIPAGTVLGRHGLVPGYRKVEVFPGGNPVIRTRRVLCLGIQPVGIATEEVPEDLCFRLAARSD